MRRFHVGIRKRINQTILGVLRTVPHSINIFRKTGRASALLYPLMDILVGISYYLGFLRAFRKKVIESTKELNIKAELARPQERVC